MNLELSDEQAALRDTTRHFLAEKASVSDHVRPLLDDPTGTDESVWRGLAGLGVTGLLVPEDCGGSGMTMVEAGIVAEELGAALHPGPWLSTAVAAPRALNLLGANDTAAELLRGIADGTTITAVCFLDLGNASVTASRRDDGVALRGEATGVPDAAAADELLVLADTAGDTGLSRCETARPGCQLRPSPASTRPASSFASRSTPPPPGAWPRCLRTRSPR